MDATPQEIKDIREMFSSFRRWQQETLVFAFVHSRRDPAYDRNPQVVIPMVEREMDLLTAKWRGNRTRYAKIQPNDLHVMVGSTLGRAQEIYEGVTR